MYGKSFESMYEGSLVGAGFHVWAVWNYVITKTHFSSVELNPKLLAFTLAGSNPDGEDLVREAIDKLCAPDPESRSKEEGGRRLVKEGQFQYRVVNWEKYQVIKSKAVLAEYNRVKKAESRAKKKAAAKLISPEQQAQLDAAHADQCASMKHLDAVQRAIDEEPPI